MSRRAICDSDADFGLASSLKTLPRHQRSVTPGGCVAWTSNRPINGSPRHGCGWSNHQGRYTLSLRVCSQFRPCLYMYTVSHRECGQFRPCVHENFEKFKMISTPTGSWIRSRRRRDRIQLPVGVEIISNFSKFSCRQGRNCPHSRFDRV